MTQQRKLENLATRILRSNGFTWSGRSKQEVDAAQKQFESRLLVNPVGTSR